MIEDRQFIEDHFAGRTQPGRFLELGANDGMEYSLTCGLVDAGWSGVQVEPDPWKFSRLLEHRRGNDRIELVNAAIAAQGGVRRFWSQQDGGQEGTLDDGHRRRSGRPYERAHWVHSLSVADLLAAFGGPTGWDFLLIDVEGLNTETLAAFPLAKMADLSLVCCESDTSFQAIIDRMAPNFHGVRVGKCNIMGRRA